MNFGEKSVNEREKKVLKKKIACTETFTELCVVELGLKPESLRFMT